MCEKNGLQLRFYCNILTWYFSISTSVFNKYGPLAHLVEHLTLNQGVRGSSPRRPTPGGLRTLCRQGFWPFIFCLHEEQGKSNVACNRNFVNKKRGTITRGMFLGEGGIISCFVTIAEIR